MIGEPAPKWWRPSPTSRLWNCEKRRASHPYGRCARRAMSGDGTGLAQHLADVGDVGGLGRDLGARVFLEHDVAPFHQPHELVVFRQTLFLMGECLAQDLVDVVFVGLEQLSELQRRVAAEAAV